MSQSFSGFQLAVKANASVFQIGGGERLAVNSRTRRPWSATSALSEYCSSAARPCTPASKEISQRRTEVSTFTSADARPRRLADQLNVAAQAAQFHAALDFLGRARVRVGHHDGFQRHGNDEQAERVRVAGAGIAR